MTLRALDDEFRQWAIGQALAGADPDAVLQPLRDAGWDEDEAAVAVQAAVADYVEQQSRLAGLPQPVPVPVLDTRGAAVLDAGDRQVQVLASLALPQVRVLGGLLSDEECDALVALAQPRMARSRTVDSATGDDVVHPDRTSSGMFFTRGENALCARIEARIAHLLGWPVENGEGLQMLSYPPGAQYKPHYDYFDPTAAVTDKVLARGGQRVATVVIYLNTPERGGATTFPDVHFEVAAVKGNAVFFSYDRAHPMTRTLHAGAPVIAGEKWIATKWLRERRYG
ncbi:MAG: 2OG-Fe(II) oxygenase [Stenotrophomonas sp.]